MNHKWTDSEVTRLLTLFHAGRSDGFTGRMMGVSAASVKCARQRLGYYRCARRGPMRGAQVRIPYNGTLKQLAQEIADEHGIELCQLRGPSLLRQFVHPRQEFFWIAYQTGRFSYGALGLFAGGRHHSTVIHGIRQHEARARGLRDWRKAA